MRFLNETSTRKWLITWILANTLVLSVFRLIAFKSFDPPPIALGFSDETSITSNDQSFFPQLFIHSIIQGILLSSCVSVRQCIVWSSLTFLAACLGGAIEVFQTVHFWWNRDFHLTVDNRIFVVQENIWAAVWGGLFTGALLGFIIYLIPSFRLPWRSILWNTVAWSAASGASVAVAFQLKYGSLERVIGYGFTLGLVHSLISGIGLLNCGLRPRSRS